MDETSSRRVCVVFDPAFASRLAAELRMGPVWIVESAENDAIARHVRNGDPDSADSKNLTTFRSYEGRTHEETLIANLSMFDDHHGWPESPDHYTLLEVIGLRLSATIVAELRDYGFDRVEETTRGFRATRD